MRLAHAFIAALLMTGACLPAWGAEVLAKNYARAFNAAADKTGAPVRLKSERCSDNYCSFVGENGITAAASGTDAGWVKDSVLRVPIPVSSMEFASIFASVLLMFSPEASASARETFAIALIERLAADKVRAQGTLRGWVYVLRYDKGERWRIVVAKPGIYP